MRSKQWITDVIRSVGVEKTTAEMIVERLEEEGVLHLGYGDADIDLVVDAFRNYLSVSKITQQDRWAAARLTKVHGSKAVMDVVKMYATATGQYKPVINNIVELENKFQSVLSFLRKMYTDRSEVIQL